MRISTSVAAHEIVLVQVEGEVDAHTSREVDRALNELLDQGRTRLVLDATDMSFISSAGLRAIVYAYREASHRGGGLRVCGLNAQVRRVFEMAALDEFLELDETRQEALEGW